VVKRFLKLLVRIRRFCSL